MLRSCGEHDVITGHTWSFSVWVGWWTGENIFCFITPPRGELASGGGLIFTFIKPEAWNWSNREPYYHATVNLLCSTFCVSSCCCILSDILFFLVILQVRFLLRGGRESEAQEEEVVRYENGLVSSLLELSIRWVGVCTSITFPVFVVLLSQINLRGFNLRYGVFPLMYVGCASHK